MLGSSDYAMASIVVCMNLEVVPTAYGEFLMACLVDRTLGAKTELPAIQSVTSKTDLLLTVTQAASELWQKENGMILNSSAVRRG
ncbi:hypothetical protein N0V88_006830 [Collariella sp. IMI 366227]|nr:hypothetical protein N0V88_006830 [Collariella sp. IMI 366227]